MARTRASKIIDTMKLYQQVFESVEGIRVLHDLMKSCHILGTTFDANPIEMAYREGERSVVLRILRTLKTNPEKILRLIEEGSSWEEKYEAK